MAVTDDLQPVPACWPAVRPPFRALMTGLVEAEGLLDESREFAGSSWRRLGDAVGSDEAACAAALNDLLHGITMGVRPDPRGRGWSVTLSGSPHSDPEQVRAAHAVALLVQSGGWARLKRCSHAGCRRVFADATNAGSRVSCGLHLARRPRSAPPAG